ncbi:RDD family protein [Streptomyces coeruleorubidus]|uniref:RDD family protein n=1 Tax=Streptomyces coeruleorubidus TaxID=116188 RepID=UPI00237F6173|nr:RDD family protein [Streptomyces coeruleorubidus]WDV52011.1 RDD family protein [Streptomyces coeruleorubidus]
MSAPTPAPGDDRPREGYYPDPSIPGYVRYWNGASWVPGTSRPAPKDGETLAPPPGAGAEQPGAAASGASPSPSGSASASVEETGPHFFDEDPADEPSPADAQHGSRPEPASAWGADRSRQSGFGGDPDRRVSWGAPQGAQGADPRVSHADRQPAGESAPQGDSPSPADQEANAAEAGSTFVFRRPTGKAGGGAPADAPDEGTMTFRAVSPRPGTAASGSGSEPAGGPGGNSGTPGFGSAGSVGSVGSGGPGSGPAASGFGAQAGSGGPGGNSAGSGFGAQGGAAGSGASGFGAAGSGFGAQAGPAGSPAGPAFGAPGGPAASADASNRPGFGAGKAAAARAAAPADPGVQASAAAPTALSGPQSAPTVPPQSGGPQPGPAASATPLSAGPGGGQSSWAQQVHRLAGAGGGDEQPVAPWKPPTEDIFQAAARRQASARPAGLGKRLVARLLDTLVLAGVTAGAAVPLGIKAVDHVNEKIEEAKLSGETVTVWLLDGTTSVYLGIVLAVLLLVGVVTEVLPTAKWGRTLGKKLMGLEVRDIEGHDAPEFGAALRRWLVYSVPGLLVVGIVGIAWCLFDKPWRQCWHDKAAHTFVAG